MLRSQNYFTKSEIVASENRDLGSNEFLYLDGSVYTGNWVGGLRDGKGRMTWADGAVYEGYWKDGQAYGRGKFTHVDGEVFHGNWGNYWVSPNCSTKTSQNGYVWLVYKQKIFEISPTSFDLTSEKSTSDLEAQIAMIKTRQDELELLISKYSINKKKYKGRKSSSTSYSDNAKYTGNFFRSQRDGIGTQKWPNGDSYRGEWKRDKITGWGTKTWHDGSSYTGMLLDNQCHGPGKYEYEDGSQYLGEWTSNTMEGQGVYCWPDNRSYIGQWQEGQMHGYGIMIYPTGASFYGGWYDAKKHGEGVSKSIDGKFSRDIWKHGRIIKPDI